MNRLIVSRYDHALVLRVTDQSRHLVELMSEKWDKIEMSDYQPTCENMIIHFVQMLQQELPDGVQLVELKLYETEKSAATWRAEENLE